MTYEETLVADDSNATEECIAFKILTSLDCIGQIV